jgi:hypothetical protein
MPEMGARAALASRRGCLHSAPVAEPFDPSEMIARFAERAEAVKRRGLPPIEGAGRQRFARQAALDFQDYAMIADSTCELDDGILTLRIDLRGA